MSRYLSLVLTILLIIYQFEVSFGVFYSVYVNEDPRFKAMTSNYYKQLSSLGIAYRSPPGPNYMGTFA